MPDKPRFPHPDGEKIVGQIIGPADVDDVEEGDESIFTTRIDLDLSEDNGESKMPNREQYERDARRLLGLNVEWQPLTAAEQGAKLGSAERVASYRNIDTTTHPRGPKIHEKQGVVAEVVRRGLLPQELLRALPTVYLGSGTDIDYPVALGARKIELVDPIFADPQAITDLEERLKRITGRKIKLSAEGVTAIPFDFGNGPEALYITIVPKAYYQEGMNLGKADTEYSLPDKVGVVILYASQGPGGQIRRDTGIEQHMAEGGVLLKDRTLFKYSQGAKGEVETVVLGKDTD